MLLCSLSLRPGRRIEEEKKKKNKQINKNKEKEAENEINTQD